MTSGWSGETARSIPRVARMATTPEGRNGSLVQLKRRSVAVLFMACLLFPGALHSDTVAVRHREGLVRGLLVLRSQDGTPLPTAILGGTHRET